MVKRSLFGFLRAHFTVDEPEPDDRGSSFDD